MTSDKVRKLVTIALIAAVYTVLTLIDPLSFGAVQLRASEILTILPAVTPLAIPGLTLGCFLANAASPIPLDVVFGTLATLLAGFASFALRKITLTVKGRKYPYLSALAPVIFNGVIVGCELGIFYGTTDPRAFILNMVLVASGELAACAAGLILFPVFERLFNVLEIK